jgi:hypothetical protein
MNGSAAPDPLDDLDDVIEELEGSEWDDELKTGDIHIYPPAGAKFEAGTDSTGKFKASSIPDSDPPDAEPPKSGIPGIITASGGFVLGLVKAVNNFYAFGTLVVLLAAFIAWLKLRP